MAEVTSFIIAQQFTDHKFIRDGRACEDNEWTFPAMGGVMDSAGKGILARSHFSSNQYTCLRPGRRPDDTTHPLQLWRITGDIIQCQCGICPHLTLHQLANLFLGAQSDNNTLQLVSALEYKIEADQTIDFLL